MNILAIADRPPRNSVLETLKTFPADLIITLGDLTYFEVQELEQVTTIPKIGVYGNHCSRGYMKDVGIMDLHMNTWEFGGMTFAGFEGSVRYKENPEAIMYTQEEAAQMIGGWPPVDVILTHCPPFGVNDDQREISHTGWTALREYVDKHQPKHLFHGHTYPTEETMVKQIGNTQIHYIYEDMTLEI